MTTASPDAFGPVVALQTAADHVDHLAARRPSIGDDGDAVFATYPDGRFPLGASAYHLVPLIEQGYAEYVDDESGRKGYHLTAAGIELRARWAEIRGTTIAEARAMRHSE